MSNGNNEAAMPAVTATNTHIPNLQKLRRDNKISFTLWVMQLEVKLNMMTIADENGKKKNLLLCCTYSVAFSAASDAIIWNRDVTYAKLETLPNENFCGIEYNHGDIIINLHDVNET